MKRILYIGNDFTKKSKYNSTLTTLSSLLKREGFRVSISSNKRNKLLRLIDMCWSVITNREVNYLLIDTFSTSNFYFAFCTSQLARVLKIKYIPILHGGNLPDRLKISPRLSKMIFNNSYSNVAPSMYLKSAFELRGYKTDFIPNTIEISECNFKERKVFAPNLFWVRAFDKTYNPQMAIKVLFELKKKYSNSKLTMVGPEKDETLALTKQLILDLNLHDCVEITGVLSKEEWYKLSLDLDIFINTTNVDNTPLSVIEAMALGLPIISTNVGGLPFLIDQNYDGILVEKDDAKGMTNAIINLICNPLETGKMAKNAREKVEKFDWIYIRDNWLELLN